MASTVNVVSCTRFVGDSNMALRKGVSALFKRRHNIVYFKRHVWTVRISSEK